MQQQLDLLFQGIELSRKLGTQALTGFEKFVSLNLDHTQDFIGRTSQQLKAACTERSFSQDPEQWAEEFQDAVRSSIESTRDVVLAASDYQTASLRLLQDQSAELQKLISTSLNEQLGAAKAVSGEKRVGKSATLVQKMAA
ncbi:phasin family protein [Dechloromonas sp. A34]|uniref:phasin family protein n=1 Tax=Dechloromonas sp. A34 TaxID=447588 RepID=UPI002248E5E0|nr:phasin family protein [Dechloromonas sp. A34]